MSQTVSPASPSSEHLPPTVYQLVRLIDETPTRHLRSHEIPSELNNALIIALHYKLVENDLGVTGVPQLLVVNIYHRR